MTLECTHGIGTKRLTHSSFIRATSQRRKQQSMMNDATMVAHALRHASDTDTEKEPGPVQVHVSGLYCSCFHSCL